MGYSIDDFLEDFRHGHNRQSRLACIEEQENGWNSQLIEAYAAV